MDSSNNSCMKSPGVGDDQDQKFNSHVSDSVSGFLNPPPQFPPTSISQSSFLPPHHLPTFLDHNPTPNHILQSSFSQSQSQATSNNNSLLNLDNIQPTISDPNTSQILSSTSSMLTQSAGMTIHLGDTTIRASGSSDNQTRVARNTKKRTRASRKALTTVMPTDTTNFRAMVQEYTGIPETPFSYSSRRLDHFSFGSAASTFRLANHLEPTGSSYPAGSLSHNVQPFVNNSLVDNLTGNFPTSTSTSSISANLYQHPIDLTNMSMQAQNMLSMQKQNQSLNSQPLRQNSLNVASLGTNFQLGSAASFVNQELDVSHGHANYADFSGLQSHEDGNQEHQLRSFNENYAA